MLILCASTGNLTCLVGLLPGALKVQLRCMDSAATEGNTKARKTGASIGASSITNPEDFTSINCLAER